VYTYSSRLEVGSPRFSTPGSFFIYVLFVALIIMVSPDYLDFPDRIYLPHKFTLLSLSWCFIGPHSIFHTLQTSHICPPSPILAEAVPGNEEDYPCIAYGTYFLILIGPCTCRLGGTTSEIACVMNVYAGGFGALHFIILCITFT
jgi:hypothetical protein